MNLTNFKQYKFLLLAFSIVIGVAFFLGYSTPVLADTWSTDFEECNLNESWEDCSIRVYGENYELGNAGDLYRATNTEIYLNSKSIGLTTGNKGHTLPIAQIMNNEFSTSTDFYYAKWYTFLEADTEAVHSDYSGIGAGGIFPDKTIKMYNNGALGWDIFDWKSNDTGFVAPADEWFEVEVEVNCYHKIYRISIDGQNGTYATTTTFDYCTGTSTTYMAQNKSGYSSWSVYQDDYNVIYWNYNATSTGSNIYGDDFDPKIWLTKNNTMCKVGTRCEIPFGYNTHATFDGVRAYVTSKYLAIEINDFEDNNNDGIDDSAFAYDYDDRYLLLYADSPETDSMFLDNIFTQEYETGAEVPDIFRNLCVILENENTHEVYSYDCNFRINWYGENELIFDGETPYNMLKTNLFGEKSMDDICGTSSIRICDNAWGFTEEWCDSIVNGGLCVVKTAFYWIFTPTTNTRNSLASSTIIMSQNFPFSVGYELYNLYDSISTSTIYRNLPEKNISLTLWNDNEVDLYSSTTIESEFKDTFIILRQFLLYLLYIGVVFYIMKRLVFKYLKE